MLNNRDSFNFKFGYDLYMEDKTPIDTFIRFYEGGWLNYT